MAHQSQVLGAPMKRLFVILALSALPCLAQSDRQWALASSTLSYHVSHPLHEVDGISHAALGKGVCHAGQCDFLVAAQVKFFAPRRDHRKSSEPQGNKGGSFSIFRFGPRPAGTAAPTPGLFLRFR